MTSDSGHRTLTREQLDAAVAMLRDERTAHPVSPRQRRLFRWYRWSIWVFCGSLVAVILGGTYLHKFPTGVIGWFYWSAFAITLLSLLASIVLFALNLKLITQTAREMVIAVRSRLWRLTAPDAHLPTWGRRVLWITKAYFWLIMAIAVAAAVLSGWPGAVITVVIAAYFFLSSARRRLALLDDADQLAQLLAGLQADGAAPAKVGVPDEVFRKVAQIEERQIERKRAEALAGLDGHTAGYALVRSRRLVQQLQETEPMIRLRIEHCIADLVDAPAPATAPVVETIAVPDTGCSISFRRDAQKLRIEVLELSGPERTLPAKEVARG